MDIYFRNQAFEVLALVDCAKTVIWTKKYWDNGDFLIIMPAGKYVPAMGDYVTRADDDRVGVVSQIEFAGHDIRASGRFFGDVLGQRVVWSQTILSGVTAENAVRTFITQNAVSPALAARKVPGLVLGPPAGFSDVIDIQRTGDNLLDVVRELCETYGYGFKVTRQGAGFQFDVFKGTDRSTSQSQNPYVIFSDQFDNLLSSEYLVSREHYRNVALVAGEGEGEDRKTLAVGNASGLDRYELFVDARDLSTNSGEVPDAQYDEQLRQRGMNSLVGVTRIFDSQIIPDVNNAYKRDYDIGDIVTVVNSDWEVSVDMRIIGVTENEDESGYCIIPTFGD
jgi:hypothetical protein